MKRLLLLTAAGALVAILASAILLLSAGNHPAPEVAAKSAGPNQAAEPRPGTTVRAARNVTKVAQPESPADPAAATGDAAAWVRESLPVMLEKALADDDWRTLADTLAGLMREHPEQLTRALLAAKKPGEYRTSLLLMALEHCPAKAAKAYSSEGFTTTLLHSPRPV